MSEEKLPSYSVLMSVYAKDKPEYLDVAIASMARQTIPLSDLVVVCDGPLTEGLDAVLAEWERELEGRMSIHRLPENGGLGTALDAGLSLCRCNFVARMDADDVSRPDRCELLLTKMVAENLDLIGGAIEEFDTVPGDLGAVRNVPLKQSDIEERLRARNPFNHVSVIFNKLAVTDAGGYQPFPWMEDYWLWARMIAAGCKCANVSDVVVDVRVGDGMYARRSNKAYLESQRRFFAALRHLGLANRYDEIKAVAERSIITSLPPSFVKILYNRLLRKTTSKR